MSPRTSANARPQNSNGTSRHPGGRRRSRAAALTPATRSSMVAFAISDGVRRHPVAGGDRRQRDHLHGVVAEADSLKGDAVHRAMVLTNPAVGAAVVVDQDLSRLAPKLLAEHRVADLHEAAARGVAILAVDDDVERFFRADVVAGATEDAG